MTSCSGICVNPRPHKLLNKCQTGAKSHPLCLGKIALAYLFFFGTQRKSKEGLHEGCPYVQQLLSRVSGAYPVLDDLVDVIMNLPVQHPPSALDPHETLPMVLKGPEQHS